MPDQDSKIVAVITPLYKERLTPGEEISLKHLKHYLGRFDRFLMIPDSFKVSYPDFKIARFDDKHFKGLGSYSRLLLSKGFYEQFKEYEYILIYQLDSLVFSEDLLMWCKMGYDYIGAPWFRDKTDPEKGLTRVGNGGLSLRKVETFLKVLNSPRYTAETVPLWKEFFSIELKDIQDMPLLARLPKKLRVLKSARKGVSWYAAHYTINEDHFWADRANLFYPEFKMAPVEVALRFSFEIHPRYCFEKNNHQLPFGCHAWTKWDKDFWEDYLLR